MFVLCLFVYFLSVYLRPPGGYRRKRRECDSMFVFCLFVYFLFVYLQVGINKGEGSVTVCLFSVCLSTSSLATSRWV